MAVKDDLLTAIARERALIARLEQEREDAQARLQTLQRELGSPPDDGHPTTFSKPMTAATKVALFRSLFRGRDDVFAKLWINQRTDRKGYAPACANEWVRGVCEKPRIKCGECPKQTLIPMSDDVVLDHLRGRHVIGVYPLLQHETCWFLAIDVDASHDRLFPNADRGFSRQHRCGRCCAAE